MLGVLGCWYYSYDDFATFVLHQVNKPNWRTYFETRDFPPYRYVIFPWLLLGAGMLRALPLLCPPLRTAVR